MKKIITLLVLLTFLKGYTQCPAPSNLVYTVINSNDALLSWTENGTATSWDVTVVPDFYVGAPLPTDSYYVSNSNPFTFVNFPSTGCNVFFVRSRCTTTDVSPWIALATSGCSTDINNYLNTLNTSTYTLENNQLYVYPNPSKNIIQIKSISTIDKITVFDSLGKTISIQTQNNNQVDIEKLSNGIYFIEFSIDNYRIYKKIIKE